MSIWLDSGERVSRSQFIFNYVALEQTNLIRIAGIVRTC